MVVFFSDEHFNLRTAYVGKTVHLLCGDGTPANRSVVWEHYSVKDNAFYIIADGDNVTDVGGRLNTSGSTLIISNVQTNDSGFYKCVHEDTGQEKPNYNGLTVLTGKLNEYILTLCILK